MPPRKKTVLPENLSFEEAFSQLEETIKQMEEGELSLQATMERYKTGVTLSKICAARLQEAEAEIDKILVCNGDIWNPIPLDLKAEEEEC